MWIWMMTSCTQATSQIKQQDSASILDTAIEHDAEDTADTTTNPEDTSIPYQPTVLKTWC